MTTDNTIDGACPESADIEGVLEEFWPLGRIWSPAWPRHSQVLMRSTRTSAKVPGTSCITLPSGAATSAPCSCGWQPWGFPRCSASGGTPGHSRCGSGSSAPSGGSAKWQPPSQEAAVVDFADGQRLLAEHTCACWVRARGAPGPDHGHHAE